MSEINPKFPPSRFWAGPEVATPVENVHSAGVAARSGLHFFVHVERGGSDGALETVTRICFPLGDERVFALRALEDGIEIQTRDFEAATANAFAHLFDEAAAAMREAISEHYANGPRPYARRETETGVEIELGKHPYDPHPADAI